eukprot:Gb_14404 [translate_table: standard]
MVVQSLLHTFPVFFPTVFCSPPAYLLSIEGLTSTYEGICQTVQQGGKKSEGTLDESTNVLSKGTTSVYVTALDGIVNVNSLFTFAVFVGLSLTDPAQTNFQKSTACDAGEEIARNLLTFQVISFGSFLFSSLVAQGLKQAILLRNSSNVNEVFKVHINNRFLRVGMLVSAIGSLCGSIFLMLALMNVIQIKLGTFACGSIWTIRAVVPLFIRVTFFPAPEWSKIRILE